MNSIASAQIRILLVDDHEVVRRGTRALLEHQTGWQVCGEATTGRQAVTAAIDLKPDVAIIDVVLPELGGIEAIRQIKRAVPDVEVVTFTARASEEIVQNVFDAGARSCIMKTEDGEHLLEAVRSAAAHKPYFTPHTSAVVFSRYIHGGKAKEAASSVNQLTPREHEIIALVAAGKSNKETSDLLGVSVRTVESHRAAIMQKLSLHSIGDLVRYAIRNGIVEA
jgi:DNA-binding NarL/FixJ family response regulator